MLFEVLFVRKKESFLYFIFPSLKLKWRVSCFNNKPTFIKTRTITKPETSIKVFYYPYTKTKLLLLLLGYLIHIRKLLGKASLLFWSWLVASYTITQ